MWEGGRGEVNTLMTSNCSIYHEKEPKPKQSCCHLQVNVPVCVPVCVQLRVCVKVCVSVCECPCVSVYVNE